MAHDRLEHVSDAFTGLAGGQDGLVGRDRETLLDLVADALGIGGRQVDLVDERDDLEVRVHRHERVGDGLRLDALRGVDHEDDALARLKRAADLVREVDVTRRVDEVELVGLAIVGVVHHADGLGLDGDAALALDVHRVEHLLHHVALLDGVGELENAVGKRGLPVIDVRDDREVAYVGGVSHSG